MYLIHPRHPTVSAHHGPWRVPPTLTSKVVAVEGQPASVWADQQQLLRPTPWLPSKVISRYKIFMVSSISATISLSSINKEYQDVQLIWTCYLCGERAARLEMICDWGLLESRLAIWWVERRDHLTSWSRVSLSGIPWKYQINRFYTI